MKKTFLLSPALLILFGFNLFSASTQEVKVNQQRMENRILELGKIGKDAEGRNYRVAFSKADQQGREYVMNIMKKAGLEVTIDFGGNIIGRRKGNDPSKKPISFGSHIDMVPDGGNYDGCVGSIGAIEVIETLNENKIFTDHPLELIIFSNEEGGLIGSKALIGKLTKEGLDVISQSGLTMREGIKAIGGDPDRLNEIIRKKGDLAAYLELHIEQGGILDQEKINIGVVEGIVGIEDWEITVEGFANHAGATPMNNRQDALLAASRLVIAINEVINSHEGRQVGTVGKISALPGAFNVIPGKVNMSLEIRDLSQEKIFMLFGEIEKRAAEIAIKSNTKISFKNLNVAAIAAPMNELIREKIIASAKKLNLSYKSMPSGAGHDAQEMSTITPSGMIFIPSVGGISHSPNEFSKAVDMANGANVLLHTILALDKK